jgi:7-keto-8-aminopelargonate synthetase-like enzyme
MAVSREIYNLSENDFLKLNEKQQYAEEIEEEY